MKIYNDIIYDMATKLENITGFSFTVESNRNDFDGLLSISNYTFVVVLKNEVRLSNKGLIISQLKDIIAKNKRPVILFAQFIANEIAEEFNVLGFNYANVAGNTYIKHENLFILIKGQKKQKINAPNQNRIFQEAGIKLIFHFFYNPECIEYTYRELSHKVDI